MIYNLEERTSLYGKAIIAFCIKLSKNELVKPLVNQLIRSGTSIGANYMEANQAASRKDFRNKIKIAQKEINETKYWLSLLGGLDITDISECRRLWKEAHELLLIFSKISSSSK